MDLNGDQPPFWSQPSPSTSNSMSRRRSSAPLITLPILIIILPIIALVLLFFIVPPFLTVTSQIFRPYNTVKKSWDSLNILLVLFAILFGIFARKNDDGSNPGDDDSNVNVSDISDAIDKNQSHQRQWFSDQYSNTKVYDRPISTPVSGPSRLRRSSSSYPDLRQDSLWETGYDRFRFFDDFDIRHSYCSPTAAPDNSVHQLRRTRSDFEDYSEVKVIPVDTFVLRSSPVPPPKSPTPPPPPPPPPPPVVRHRPRRTYQTAGRKDKNVESDVDMKEVKSQPPPPPQRAPPPPPPPPVQMGYRSEQKQVKIERRKSNATKEIKMVLASIYNQRKRIKKKHKTKNIGEYGNPVHLPSESPHYSTIPPPPPPPLPPHPASIFQNLFKKSSKSKKVHSIPPPAPPPPPPPRLSKRKSEAPPPPPPPPAPTTLPTQPSRRRNTASSGKPPLPARANNSYYDNLNSGNQSPLIPMPPPTPPFKMPEFRFAVRGDFVSIRSAHNSRCSSPDLEEVDNDISSTKESPAKKVNVMDAGDEVGSVFCPSPDVNIKADTFIARLRDEWRLEKMNSWRERSGKWA